MAKLPPRTLWKLTDSDLANKPPLSIEEERAIPADMRPMIFSEDRVHYLDSDVLTEAKKRIRHCLITHDRCAVSYSGGKDSHVVLYLVREVMDEMGWTQPLDVVFRDEELIPDDVIEHVCSLRDHPDKFTLHYFAVPMRNQFFLLGKHIPYIQWDNDREWVRPKPDFAITDLHPSGAPMIQLEMQALINHRLGWKGSICMFNGIRAQESLLRFRSCNLTKNRYNYIAGDAGGAKDTHFVKPIYDWSTHDIFRFFYDRQIAYCRIYDAEMLAGTSNSELRVSTPLHDQAYGYLCRLRRMYPVFFEQLARLFPGVAAHERYWRDFDRFGIIDRYPKSFEGIVQFIEDTIDDENNRKRAIHIVKTCRTSKANNRRMGKYAEPGLCFGYPILHVFKKIVGGDYLKGVQVHSNPDAAMIAYERDAEEEARLGIVSPRSLEQVSEAAA